MAREVIIKMTDDLDREQEATVIRELGVDDHIYTIDLTEEHSNELDELLATWIDAAHSKVKWPKRDRQQAQKSPNGAVPVTPGTTIKANPAAEKARRQKIRNWGRKNGWQVADRGYVPKALEDAYTEAHTRGKKNA